MTALTRGQALSAAAQIRDETAIGANTATRVGTLLSNLIDSTVFQGEAQTPPSAGDGLTGTDIFSVVADGTSLTVSAAGIKITDITGPAFLGRAINSSGAVVAIAGSEGQAARVLGGALGFGTLATAAYADGSLTLAKMANVATDSLLGRDTAGLGAPEVISLNATLSMTGAGALQRAALTGAVSAPAGSNTVTFASGDFGALNLSTTGFITVGASAATSGVIRLASQAKVTALSTLAVNQDLLQLDSGDNVKLGNTTSTVIIQGSSSVRVINGSNEIARFGTTSLRLGVNDYTWDNGSSTPRLYQETNTANGATGRAMLFNAQDMSGTTSTGAELGLRPGSGTSAGGELWLGIGSGTKRIRMNDIGLAFFTTAPVAKQAPTGSRGGNAALASLLTALAASGLITDSTSA